MRRCAAVSGLLPLFILHGAIAATVATWPTDGAAFVLRADGSLAAISRPTDGRSYLATNQPAPLLSLQIEGNLHAPDSASWNASAKRVTLRGL